MTNANEVKININENIKEEIIQTLLKESISIPDDWFEEIFIARNGDITFSNPQDGNTHTEDPEMCAKIRSSTIHDWIEGIILYTHNGEEMYYYTESDTILDDDENVTNPETLLTKDEIISNLEEHVIETTTELDSIYEKIQEHYNEYIENEKAAGTVPRAIYKDGCIRCEKCECEIWEDIDCDCGFDGDDHPGLNEAYEERKRIEEAGEA